MRVCLLTGASGLLGTAFIERYASQYHIAGVYSRNPVQFATQHQSFVDPLAPSEEVPTDGEAVHAICADLSKSSEIDRVVDDVATRFGRVDLLVNGAALRGWSHLLAPGAEDAAERVLNLNVLAPLRLSVRIARRLWLADPAENLRENRNIVNVSSTAGLFVYPDLGQGAYGASKSALNHLTYHLASDLWDIGVRVNAVAPDTFPGRVPLDEVLETIRALDSSTRTGEVLPLHPGAAR